MLNRIFSTFVVFTLLLGGVASFVSPNLAAQVSPLSSPEAPSPLTAELLIEEEVLSPGRPVWVAVHFKLEPEWHAYWKNPGGVGFPTTITWQLPSGFEAGEIQWPYPEKWESADGIRYGYSDEATFLVQITPPANFKSDKPVKIEALVNWLICSDLVCLPGEETLVAEIPVMKTTSSRVDPRWKDIFSNVRSKLAQKPQDYHVEKKQNEWILSFSDDLSLDAPVKEMYFCPESNGTVNSKVKVQFETAVESPSDYKVHIAAAEEGEAETETTEPLAILKGTLVVVKGEGNHPLAQAWDMEIPLTPPPQDDQTLALADELISDEPVVNAFHKEQALTIGWALLFAFVGGMILNLMPCVLPVISLKIFSFIKMSRESRLLIFKHGLMFCAGVLASFWVLAGVLMVLKTYGHSAGWGFQLQEPIFVALLGAVLFVFGLSLFGVFEVGTKVASWAGQTDSDASQNSHSSTASFFSGVLATAVATPCTGPFLGSAVGFAMTVSVPYSFLIFTFLGCGMAFPYLMLSAFPALLRFVPKPGAWMVTFKELMGFCMMGSCLWLTWVFGAQTDLMAVFMLFAAFFFLAFGCWVYGKWVTPMQKTVVKWVGISVTALSCALAGYIIFQAASISAPTEILPDDIAFADAPEVGSKRQLSDWEPYSPQRLQELQAQGIPVIVDFTAKWCLICQTNHLILSGKEVTQKLKERGVVKMLADWTKKDPMIAQELQKFGRSGVPLYLFYGPDAKGSPEVLPQVLTPDIVLQALEKIPKKTTQ